MTIDLDKFKENLIKLSKERKSSKELVIFITNYAMKEQSSLFNGIKENISNYIAFLEVKDRPKLEEIIQCLRELGQSAKPKLIIFDSCIVESPDHIEAVKQQIAPIKFAVYSEAKAWSDSVVSLSYEYYNKYNSSEILLAGDSDISYRILPDLYNLNSKLCIFAKNADELKKFSNLKDVYDLPNIHILNKDDLKDFQFDLLISAAIKENVFDERHIECFKSEVHAIDAGINNFNSSFIKHIFSTGGTVTRFDNRSALSSNLISILETKDLVSNVMGKLSFHGQTIVAGGFMGERGDIIVDNLSTPSSVIGIADGEGKVLYPPFDKENQDRVASVVKHINNN